MADTHPAGWPTVGLSELVKINPANIGVGMYQHDVKAKHLRESLDAVIESKRFANRDKDRAALPVLLETLRLQKLKGDS